MKDKLHKQMSEALITMFFLTLSGGLQDTYTYMIRGKVFANAETGNIILLATHLFSNDLQGCIKYIFPIVSFAIGVFVAERISSYKDKSFHLHWRQVILLIEILILVLVAWIPNSSNNLANAFVSFTCALQVQTFRKVNGHPFASTMCIGNLRSGTEALSRYLQTHDPYEKSRSLHYFFIIFTFALGAGLGSYLSTFLGNQLILVSCAFLLISFLLMFVKPLEEGV